MDKFLSCDWGTSAFRLRLVEAETLTVLAEITSDHGIAATYAQWNRTQKMDQEERLLFYLDYIRQHINKIDRVHKHSLHGVPLILSGMASSSIGMVNLPYAQLPFAVDGSDAVAAFFESREAYNHPLLLISGLRSELDVMRGEEVQLIGAVASQEGRAEETVYIFPGTHSKHIHVKGKQVTHFKTYMTGEYFELLSQKSILRESVENNPDLQSTRALHSFQQGVQDAIGTNLLHTSFMVRTNDLFSKRSKKENFNYLSGLIIGTELHELLPLTSVQICLCSSSHLKTWYKTALQVLGLLDKVQVLSAEQAEEAVIRGQLMIYHYYKNKE